MTGCVQVSGVGLKRLDRSQGSEVKGEIVIGSWRFVIGFRCPITDGAKQKVRRGKGPKMRKKAHIWQYQTL
jgi:hypothetical protein